MSIVSSRVRRLAFALVGLSAWVSAGCGEAPTPQDTAQARPAEASHELVIQDASVLNDPTRTAESGAWSFGRLVATMSGPVAPSDFVRDNLPRWAGQDDASRERAARLLETWPTLADGSLDLDKAPLRLAAIVHRPDSRGGAGEGRFVFDGVDASGTPLGLSVTLKYVTAQTRDQAQHWQALASKAPGSEAFNAELQSLTDRFTASPAQVQVTATPEAAASRSSRQVSALLADDTQPPSVTLSSPAAGSFLRGTFVVTANAYDNVGVSRVDFYDGTTLIGSSYAAPFSVSWNTTSTAGNRTLTAQAFDAAGNSTTSSPVTVMVDNSPPVPITGAPQYNPVSQNYVRGVISVGWTVTDQSLSGVALTEFMQEGTVIATAAGQPGVASYNFDWDTRVLSNRSYSLSIRATDNAGNSQVGNRSLIVDNVLPTSVLTAPSNGAVVVGNVTLSANASDTQALYQVVFEIDGVSTFFVSGTSPGPYTRTWDTTGKPGTHTIVAVASDRAGNVRRSNAVTVIVP
jgi:hypothetical protein